MSSFVVPAIERVGLYEQITEIQVSELRYKFCKYQLSKVDRSCMAVDMYSPLEPPKKKIFYLERFCFKVGDGRMVSTQIYIDREAFCEFGRAQREWTERFVQEHAAWFFSYGLRERVAAG